jgi:hypothetical protein
MWDLVGRTTSGGLIKTHGTKSSWHLTFELDLR